MSESVDRELIIAQLEMVAAKAKSYSIKMRNRGLWEGELSSAISDMLSELNSIARLINRNTC